MRGYGEGFSGQPLPVFKRCLPLLLCEQFYQCGVLLPGGNDHHVPEILCGGPDKGNPPDVNFLDDLLVAGTGTQGFLEGVKIDDHQVDARDFVFLQLGLIRRVFPAVKDPAENLRMQGLHPAPENGWITGQVLDRPDLQSQVRNEFPGAPGGDNFDVKIAEMVEDRFQSILVEH